MYMLITIKKILILGEATTQGLDDTKLTAEKKFSINFAENNKKYCLSLYNNGVNSYLFVNDTEIIKFKEKHSDIVADSLCLENASKELLVDNITITGLNGYFYDFSVDYDAIAVNDILDVHKYLMQKNGIA